jgi:hypothetical protein
MRHDKDILWKGLLEWVFDDLLRFVFPNADMLFNMEKGFAFLDKELAELYPEPEKASDTRVVDKLVKVFRKDGGEEWVLIHIEAQGETKCEERPLFSERMFRYFYRCLDKYRRPIAAIALFTGPDARRMPASYQYAFLNTRLHYEYNTLCILDYSDKELGESDNPFAWVVLAAKKALLQGKDLDNKLLKGKLFIFRKLYLKGVAEKQKLRAIFAFLNNYLRFEDSEFNRKFSNEIDKITDKKNSMDIFEIVAEWRREEAVEEGLKKGLEKAVEVLLANTEFSVEKIASEVGVSVSFVENIKNKLQATP